MNDIEIGNYHVGKVGNYSTRKFFTVEDGSDIHVYERPYGESDKDIRIAVTVAFIDEMNYSLKYKVTGRYPNYHIEEMRRGEN